MYQARRDSELTPDSGPYDHGSAWQSPVNQRHSQHEDEFVQDRGQNPRARTSVATESGLDKQRFGSAPMTSGKVSKAPTSLHDAGASTLPVPLPEEKSVSFIGGLANAVGEAVRSISHNSRDLDQMGSPRSAGEYAGHAPSRNEGPPLLVFVTSAENLKKADFMGLSDPYVKVGLKSREGVKRRQGPGDPEKTWMKQTTYKEQNLNPVWDEVLELYNYQMGDELFLEVWDKDFQPWQSDDLLGTARLSGDQVAYHFDGVAQLHEESDKPGTKQTLKLRVQPPEQR